MNGYLFDTDALSQPLKKRPSPFFEHWINEIPFELQFTSSISAAEMIYGARRLPDSRRLRGMVEELLSEVRILPFDVEAAEVYGELRAKLEKAGTPVATHDLMIASIALSANLVLVTGNTRHFKRIPDLRVEDWIQG